MKTVQEFDVCVIGGGPAGLAAALEAHKQGAKVLILERDQELGGILQQCIHNGFGLHYFGEELTGPEYAQRFIDIVEQTDIQVWLDTMVIQVSNTLEILCVGPKTGLVQIKPRAVVLAMGCRERTRGALGIPGTRPSGVYTAGCAQRLVNIEGYMPGKQVVVLGSGDIGMIMARRMTWEGAKVLCVAELMPYSSGLNRNIVQCLNDNQIPLEFETTVVGIHGKERLEAVTLCKVDKERRPIPETERRVACDTLLLSVGLLPENELSRDAGVEMDPVTGGARVDETRQTSVPGLYACGNVLHVHDLVDNVSQEAVIAGEAAAKYALSGQKASQARQVRAGAGVRYAVPQYLSQTAQGKVTLYFRSTQVVTKATIKLTVGDTAVASRKKLIVTPGEMESFELALEQLPPGDITVSVEGEQRA